VRPLISKSIGLIKMRYIYDVYDADNQRVFTGTDLEQAEEAWDLGGYIRVTDNFKNTTLIVRGGEALQELRDMLEKVSAWKPQRGMSKTPVKTDAINPKHYKHYCLELQWIEAMMLLPTFEDPKVFEGALELQVRKYLDRRGQKDNSLQELKKARWYLDFWIRYKEEGKNTRVK